MNNEQLQRTLRLLKRTKDKGFIMDGDGIFVLMDVDSYEDILDKMDGAPVDSGPQNNDDVDAKGDYVLDEIIATEESRKKTEEIAVEEIKEEELVENTVLESAEVSNKEISKSEGQGNKKPIHTSNFGGLQKLQIDPNWLDKKRNNSVINEESLADVPHDSDEEEKFYLEPVE